MATRRRDVSFGDDPHGIEDLEIVAHGNGVSFAVSHNAGEDARNAVTAVAVARALGLKSLDYTRKNYVESRNKQPRKRDRRRSDAINITAEAIRFVKQSAQRGYRVNPPRVSSGLFAAGSVLLRLPVTFRAAALSIRNGFHFESMAIARLILEQLAWAIAVLGTVDDSLFEVEPQRCLSSLKHLLPHAGRQYGLLSRLAHLVPEEHHRFLEFKESGASITLTSLDRVQEDALVILSLADSYCVVCDFVFRDYFGELEHIVREGNKLWVAKEGRTIPSRVQYWREHVDSTRGDPVARPSAWQEFMDRALDMASIPDV